MVAYNHPRVDHVYPAQDLAYAIIDQAIEDEFDAAESASRIAATAI
jgi:hypothetical protein